MLKRDKEIKVRFTPKELDYINRCATRTHRSREAYIRMVLSGTVPREAPPADYYNLIIEVRRVGNNLNQLLKVANSTGFIDSEKLKTVLADNRNTEQLLWKTFAPEVK